MPHDPGRLILSLQSFEDFLVRLERKDGLPRIVVRDRKSGEEHAIAFDEEAYSLGLSGAYEYDTDSALLLFVDDHAGPGLRLQYAHPRARAAQDAGSASGHDPDDYVTRRLWRRADGELVPSR